MGGQDGEPSARGRAAPEPVLEQSADDLYENAPCGFFSTGEDGTFVRVNGTFLNWTGYRREEVVGRKRIHDLLAPGDRIYYETHYMPLLRMQGAVREVAVEVVGADGARMSVFLTSVLARATEDEPPLVRTIVFDATERRRYERELLRARREAEERARAALALAHVDDGVLLVDADGRVQVVNPAGASILGVSGDSVVGRAAAEAIPGWDSIAGRIPTGAPERSPAAATLPFARGGEEAWLAVVGIDSGDGVVYTIRDVTAERRLEELRSDVVAVVSHELRTPLAGMYGAAQTLLHHDALEHAVRQQLLDVIVQQAEAQTRVLDAIAFTGRLDADGVALAQEAFRGDDVLRDVAAGAGGRILVETAEPVSVRADRAGTEQVLANLVENALKYAPGTTPVRLAVRARERWARFTVADEGPGVPIAERELVFEKFYRLDPEQHSGVGGVGLGLYIARELVARMGGRIGVLATGSGATFFVDLPLVR